MCREIYPVRKLDPAQTAELCWPCGEGQELALNVQYKLMAHNILNREHFHRQQVSDVEAKILIKWSHACSLVKPAHLWPRGRAICGWQRGNRITMRMDYGSAMWDGCRSLGLASTNRVKPHIWSNIIMRCAKNHHSFIFTNWQFLFWLAVGLYVTKHTAECH